MDNSAQTCYELRHQTKIVTKRVVADLGSIICVLVVSY